MFSGEWDKKYALLIGNHMKDCYEDIVSLENILLKYNFDKIYNYKDCSPEAVITNFFKNINPYSSEIKGEGKDKDKDKEKSVLIYIHYSGHGVKRGLKINNKVEILSCWLDYRNRIFSSYDFYILVNKFFNLDENIKIKFIISSDSCHSGEFDRYLSLIPSFSYIFISSSPLSLITLPKKDTKGSVKGIIVSLFEQLLKEEKEISVENLLELSTFLFNKKEIKNNISVILKE